MSTYIKIIFFLLFCFKAKAQISFLNIPSDLQLIPRNINNIGVIPISGYCLDTLYSKVRTKISDASTNIVLKDSITTFDSFGNFFITHQITAALKEYNLHIFLVNNTNEILVKTVSNIVCGDVFIVSGQSNAQASLNDYSSNPFQPAGIAQNFLYSNRYCRSVGSNIDYATYKEDSLLIPVSEDYKFSRPSSIFWEVGFVGAWAIKLQSMLANSTGIPNCIINGAKNGSPISLHYPSNSPSVVNNLNLKIPYDRLYKKLSINGLTNFVKAIFWYQGETDANLSYSNALDYKNRFDKLYNSWKLDYPNVMNIFLFQINMGCGTNDVNGSLVRELQRKIPEEHSDVVIMSTIGSTLSDRSNDSCHYSLNGYNNIADKISPVVEKYIYSFSHFEDTILPPKIVNAYVSKKNQICLQFNMPIYLQNSAFIKGVYYYIKNYFYGTNFLNLNLSDVFFLNNTIYLNFPLNVTLPTQITYLPNNLTNNGLYVGPWVLNLTHKIGALSFFEFPVDSSAFFNTKNAVSVFPNPSKDMVTVSFEPNFTDNFILITSSQGKVVFELDYYGIAPLEISTAQYNNGLYFVTVKNKNGTTTKKLIIN